MSKAIARERNLRSSLLLGAASVAAIAVSAPAMAQDDQSVETVVVTGSRIPQTGLYSTSPVTAIGQQEFKLQGSTNVETLLRNLPATVADGEVITQIPTHRVTAAKGAVEGEGVHLRVGYGDRPDAAKAKRWLDRLVADGKVAKN